MEVAIVIFGSVITAIGGVIVTYLMIVSAQLAKQGVLWERQNDKWEQQAALWKKNEEDHLALVRLIADVKADLKADISRLENRIIRLEDKIDELRSR